MTVITWVHGLRRSRPERVPGILDASSDTGAALTALASFQQITEQMDGKVNTLVGVHLALVAVVTGQSGAALKGGADLPAPIWAVGAVTATAALVTSFVILAAFRPHLAEYPEFNHWAVPDRVGRPRSRPSQEELAAEAWQAAEAVGRIAAAKNRSVRRATTWLLITVVASLAWLVLLP